MVFKTGKLIGEFNNNFSWNMNTRNLGYFLGGCVGVIQLLLQTIVQPCGALEASILPNVQAVLAIGESYQYFCSTSELVMNVEWLINDTSLNDLNLTNVEQKFTVTIRFTNVTAEYNNTRIRCTIGDVESFNTQLLLVQGLLSAVGSFLLDTSSEYINIHWTAPFTLDITSEDPDITYCIDVVSYTSLSTLHSQCEINETEFTYPRPRSFCEGYNFTVTPVNLAGNGTAKTIQYPLSGPRILAVSTNYTTLNLLMSAVVCQVEELVFFELDTASNLTLSEANVTLSDAKIIINLQLLTSNRRYSFRVSASNAGGEEVSDENETISTHDVNNCSASSSNGGVTILVSFITGSMATGVLLGINFEGDDGIIDFSKSFFKAVERSDVSSSLTVSVDLWNPGRYVVNAYDIESNGRIVDGTGYQATSCSVDASSPMGTPPPSESSSCSISSYLRMITVSCSSFATFQVLAQLNAQDSVGILYVNTSEDTQTPVILHVPENGEYLVTALPVDITFGVAFSQILMVTDVVITTTATTAQSKTTDAMASIGVSTQPLPFFLFPCMHLFL